MSTVFDQALLMIASTRAALKNGVKHFDKAGNPLSTEEEIINALIRDGEVEFDVRERIQVTTDEEELVLVKRAFGGH